MKRLHIGLIVVMGVIILLIIIGLIVACRKNQSTEKLYFLLEAGLVKLKTFPPILRAPTLGSKIPIYYINLKESTQRRIRFESQIKEFDIQNPVHRVEAINGKKELTSIFHGDLGDFSFVNHTGKVSFAEAGCILSHLRSWIDFYRSGHDKALIFEDDISFALLPFWPRTLDEIIGSLPAKNTVLHLASTRVEKKPFRKLGSNDYSTLAYLISRTTIHQVLLSLCENFDMVVKPHFSFYPTPSTHSHLKRQFSADIGLYPRCKPLIYTGFPTFIPLNDASDFNSTIHSNHTRGHMETSLNAIHFYIDILKKR